MNQKMIDFLTNAISTIFHKFFIKTAVNVRQLNPPILKSDINVEYGNLSIDVTPNHIAFYIYQKDINLCSQKKYF